MFKGQTVLLFLVLACAAAPGGAQEGSLVDSTGGFPNSMIFAWLKDDDGEDPSFLAVIDSDPESDSYGQLLTTATTGMPLQDAHHTPHSLPTSGRLFANAFRDGHTFIFDTSVPWLPRLRADFERIGDYSYPHSFVELPSGNFLVTFQTSGEDNDAPGGLVELSMDGDLVRASSAADPGASDFIRPYSLEVFTDLDRIVSSSADMWGTQATEHVQLWRRSDLALLDTIALPEGERRNIHQIPLEVRALDDGNSAYVITWNCGLYRIGGIGGSSLSARLVWDFNSSACAIPLRMGNYWIQAVGEAWQVVVLDISNPDSPQLATVLQFPDEFQPHWIAAEPGGDRIVLTGYKAMADRIVMLRFNAAEQNLSVDERFGALDVGPPGFSTDREFWPHGRTGPATAHGVVFWPAGEIP